MAAPQRKLKADVSAWNVFTVQAAIREQLSIKEKLSGLAEREIVSHVWEQTWAKQRTPGTPAPEWARLTLAQIAKACGLKGKNATDVAQRYITRLKQAGILTTRKEGRDQVLQYRLTPEKWADAPKYEPKGLANVIEMPAPAEDETPAEEQQALPGLEHIAIATQKARTMVLDALTTKVSFKNQLPLNVGIDCRVRGEVTQFVLREENKGEKVSPPTYRSGVKNAVTAEPPPTQQVGGQKSGDLKGELQRGLRDRKHPVLPTDAHMILDAIEPCRDVAFYLERVDVELEKCKASGKRFNEAWLWTSIAAKVKGLWPQVKEERERVAREQAEFEARQQARCSRCGALPEFCDCPK